MARNVTSVGADASTGAIGHRRTAARLARFLDHYGYSGDPADLLDVVGARAAAHAAGIRRLAATGDPLFTRLLDRGVAADLDRAVTELADFHP